LKKKNRLKSSLKNKFKIITVMNLQIRSKFSKKLRQKRRMGIKMTPKWKRRSLEG